MKIALVLRGQHYLKTSYFFTDFEENVKNIYKTLINPYRDINMEVDIFFLTYESPKVDILINAYKPVKYCILADSERNNNTILRQHIWHYLTNDIVVAYEAEKNIKYDIVINTRFDITFVKKFTEMDINFDKMNIAFEHSSGNCDDNLFIFPRRMLEDFKKAWHEMTPKPNTTHEFNHFFPKDEIHYMSIVSDEEWGANLGDKVFRLTRRRWN
jgi:hypothetical protein